MRKLQLFFVIVFVSFAFKGVSQIRDISFTVSPLVEHTWWDNNLTLDNSSFWGGRVGFGFGPLFEIRGFYQKSFDVEAALRDINWKVTDNWADNMTHSFVNISRYGGELKLNLVKSTFFSPYLTAGAGVQTMKYDIPSAADPLIMDNLKEEQLFGTVGLGTKFNISDRIVLSLEAKNTFFNVNEQSYYLEPNFTPGDNKRLYNWSALASLDFYLGGIKNENASAVERAYANMFTDGFRGMKFVLEPGGTYINFNDNTPFADQYFVGGSAGFDFSSLVGIRGFYYQATEEPNKISLDLNNNLAMYGGNIIARLNYPRGVNPYLSLGGGYMKVGDDYIDKYGLLHTVESTPFAFGGVGLEIPLSRYVALYGTINAILTSKKSLALEELQTPCQVKTSTMYQAGVRLNIGAASDAQSVYQNTLSQAVLEERELTNQRINELRSEYEQSTSQQIEEMRKEYEARINRLNAELDEANELNDARRANDILIEKKRAERILYEMDNVSTSEGRLIRMSSDDFERLVDRVLREVRQESYEYQQGRYYDNSQQLTPLEERLLQQLDNNNQLSATQSQSINDAIISDQLSELNNKLDRNYNKMNQIEATQGSRDSSPVIITDRGTAQRPIIAGRTDRGVVTGPSSRTGGTRFFKLNRVGLFGGLGFGDMTSFNVGVRGYLQISSTPLDFVPEFYAALGDKNGIGISGNVIYNFNHHFKRLLNPYVGLGLGVFPGDKTHLGSNIIIGSSIDVLGGNLFVDYSARRLFKQNQIAVGYKFVF